MNIKHSYAQQCQLLSVFWNLQYYVSDVIDPQQRSVAGRKQLRDMSVILKRKRLLLPHDLMLFLLIYEAWSGLFPSLEALKRPSTLRLDCNV